MRCREGCFVSCFFYLYFARDWGESWELAACKIPITRLNPRAFNCQQYYPKQRCDIHKAHRPMDTR